MQRPGLVAACALTTFVVAAAAVLRAAATPDQVPLPDRLFVVLVAVALLLVALLALPRAAAVAWAAVTVGAALGSLEIVGVARELEPVNGGPVPRELSTIAVLSLATAAAIAAAYSARSRGAASVITRAVLLAVGAGTVATVVAAVWAIAQAAQLTAADAVQPLRIVARIAAVTVAGGSIVGAARDLLPAAARAYEQSLTHAAGRSGGKLWAFAAALADELLPGRVADRRRAAENERARLAADLHALVLPELRRVAAIAEAAGMPADVQVDLRRALEDVETLMHERQSIVLDQFGLVAALEWLAERTEERSPLRVELELDGHVPDRPDSVDPTISRAAFRIALLALDNVVRHAGATTATIRLAAGRSGLRLEVTDDGADSRSRGGKLGRGIADMRAAAEASGGNVEVELGERVRVDAAWPRAQLAANHAAGASEIADRSRMQAR